MTRKECPGCGRPVLVNRDGQLRLHRTDSHGTVCNPRPSRKGWQPRNPSEPPNAEFNRRKAAAAAERDVVIAEKLLVQGRWSGPQLAVTRARAQHPGWNWAQVGETLGVSKYQAASMFRRMSLTAGLRPDEMR